MVKKHLLAFLFVLFVFLLYVYNLSRSVYGGDVGDLVTASVRMGVAHPPGYPLFTILGYLLTRLSFLPVTPAFLVGLISAISASIGLLVFYFLSFLLSKNKIASLLATSILAFSFLYWFYAEIAEVFALNSFFAIVLFFFAILIRKKSGPFLFFIFFLFTGLSLTNHQTIIFIFPSLFLLLAKPWWSMIQKSKKQLFLSLLGLGLGFLPYLYIPWAASHNPVINWDNVHDIPSFFHLVLRQDYGTFQAGIFDKPTFLQRLITIRVYLLYLLSQVTIPVVTVSICGLGVLWKRDRMLFGAFVLAFLLSGPFFVAYAGFPLTGSFILGVYERFFALSALLIIMPFSIGILWLATRLSNVLRRTVYITIFQLVFFMIPLALLLYNFPKTNLSSVMIGDTYAEDLLLPLPAHSLLVFNGDTLVFNTWYVHYVRGVRSDISLYNMGGEVQNKTVRAFLQTNETQKKEGTRLDTLISSLVTNSKYRPVFSTVQLQPTKDAKKITWVPYGLVYQLVLSSDELPSREAYLARQEKIWSSFRIPSTEDQKKKVFHNFTLSEFPAGFSNAALVAGNFIYTHYADTEHAEMYYKKAVTIAPDNAKAYEVLGAYYLGIGGKCPEVAANLTTAIGLNPFEKLPYLLLYSTYKDCFHQQDSAKTVASQFSAVFHQDLVAELKKQTPENLFDK